MIIKKKKKKKNMKIKTGSKASNLPLEAWVIMTENSVTNCRTYKNHNNMKNHKQEHFNPWSPAGSFMVREMAITSPFAVF